MRRMRKELRLKNLFSMIIISKNLQESDRERAIGGGGGEESDRERER